MAIRHRVRVVTLCSNLSQVRASNLQELVYKQGQAGVSRASVTIVFNNEDTSQSPVGYEQYDRIEITRQVRCTAWRGAGCTADGHGESRKWRLASSNFPGPPP